MLPRHAARLANNLCPSVRYVHFSFASSTGEANRQRQFLASLGLFLLKHYRGTQFVTCWLLWQMLRAKIGWRTVRSRFRPMPIASRFIRRSLSR